MENLWRSREKNYLENLLKTIPFGSILKFIDLLFY